MTRPTKEVPKMEMPAEFHAGPVVIPAVYARLLGIGLTIGLLVLVASLID